MDWVRLGQGLRAIRHERGWTQTEVARRARVSQSAVSRAERGRAGTLTGETLGRIATALDARYVPRVLWQGEALDRLLDAAHAGLVDQVVALLAEHGWEAIPEATFNHYGERGSIDVLAWHPEHRALLVVEVKSVVPDMQAMLSGVDRKARVAIPVAAARGWVPRVFGRIIVLPDHRTARRRVDEHAATLDRAYPARTRAVRHWITEPTGELSGILFLPSSQRTTRRLRIRPSRGT